MMNSKQPENKNKKIYSFFICIILLATQCGTLFAAGIRDRVVAFVDDTAITLSELEERYTGAVKVNPSATKDEVLNTMINRIILLREAKKLRIEAPSEDVLLREYIDLKLRPLIRFSEETMINFYQGHAAEFHGKGYDSVREEIEAYLTEEELNRRMKKEIEELRQKAYIKIQIAPIDKP
jgi:hypothetical protein